MEGEELQIARLRDDFYRDGFYKVIIALVTLLTAIFCLIGITIYFMMDKPPPVSFSTDEEWRILPPIPVDQVYIKTPDLIQWVSTLLPRAFTFDFINYTEQLKALNAYFTPNGWKKFLNYINQYANYNTIRNSKLFLIANAGGAPFILNQGLLEGRYAWWIQMPINVTYISIEKSYVQNLMIQALVVRVPTLNNIEGVAIDNILINEKMGEKTQNNA